MYWFCHTSTCNRHMCTHVPHPEPVTLNKFDKILQFLAVHRVGFILIFQLTSWPSSQSCGFSSSHVRMWELDHKEGWVLKNWHFWIVMLENTFNASLGLQGDPTSQSKRISVLNIHWKDWCRSSNILAS